MIIMIMHKIRHSRLLSFGKACDIHYFKGLSNNLTYLTDIFGSLLKGFDLSQLSFHVVILSPQPRSYLMLHCMTLHLAWL